MEIVPSLETLENSLDVHSSHCDNCINVSNCEKLRILSKIRPEEIAPCPIIYCRFNCGHRFHGCKLDEHLLLCSKVKVPCINQEFGCPLILERSRRGIHLETCPASVVCTMEWNRWPLPPGNSQPFTLNPLQLDVASTLMDQKTISEWKEHVPSTLRHLLRTYVNERHPVMPLGVSSLRIPKSIINQGILERNLKAENDISESTESEHDESSDSPWGWKHSPPGLQESVCNKLKSLKVSHDIDQIKQNDITNVDHDDEFHSCSSSVHENDQVEIIMADEQSNAILNGDSQPYEFVVENGANNNKKPKEVELSLMVEVRTRCQKKPDSMYTFMCSKEFRRDQFPVHFSQIHSEIHSQLNGWLYMRCPLANQGCDFGIVRMHPCDENYRVIYNQTEDAFCFTQQMDNHFMNAAGENKTNISNTEVSLSSLPFELLIHLTKYLDPLSLNTLSMTSHLFRDVSTCVVVDRGIVVYQWEKKDDCVGWKITEKKWIFSQSFSPIRKWAFSDGGRMITHMTECPYFDRNEHKTIPFAYPVKQDQL